MAIETLETENFHQYDIVVSETLTKIYLASYKKQAIHLFNFDKNNFEHLFLLRVAMLARDLFGFPIFIHGSSAWDIYRFNRKIKKKFLKVKRDNSSMVSGIAVPYLLEELYCETKTVYDFYPNFSAIYNSYYKGDLD